MKQSIILSLVVILIIGVYAQTESSTGDDSSSSSSSSTGSSSSANSTSCLYSNDTSCRYYSTVIPDGTRFDNGSYVDYRYNLSECTFDTLRFANGNVLIKQITAYYKLQTVPVCIKMGGLQQIIFFPNVDDYTLMQVAAPPDQKGHFDDSNMWVQVEVAISSVRVVSPPKKRMSVSVPAADSGDSAIIYVVPYWVAIVNLKDGIPTGIDWDDGCYGCGGDSCIMDTCAVDKSTCEIDGLDCDIKVYMGWFGTDGDGQYLVSAGKRPSRFKQYSISSAVSSAANTAYDNLPDAPTFSGNDDGTG